MDQATMSYAQLLAAYQALQERMSALEGVAALQQQAPALGHETPPTARTHEMRIASEDGLAGGGQMGERIRAFDWAATPLGAVAQWPQSLLTAVSICQASRFPIVIYWGAEYVTVYNDAYSEILAKKHPGALGRRARDVWAEIWDVISPMLDSVRMTGQATWSDDLLLLLERYGYPEECYFSFSFSPVRGEHGQIGGVFTAVTETTQRVIGERRLRTLRDLAAGVGEAKSGEEACHVAVATMAGNPADLPFALLYLCDAEGTQAQMVGLTGLAPDTPASARLVDLTVSEPAPQQWPLGRVARTAQAELVADLAERFGPLPGGLWPESPHTALILPIASPTQESLAGFLVAGVSPRRALDDAYRGFLELVAGHVATAIANARAYEAERRRAEALAEIDRAKTAFFSNVSHEFRTPLTLMLGPLEQTLAGGDGALTPPQRAELEVVHRNGLRLFKLVNTLLDFSRIEAGRIQAVYEPTDLAACTAELASVFRSAIERAGLRLVVECPALPIPVYVDREMWEKIVLNLLSNAFKFTFEGEIGISLGWCGEHVSLTVRDTGTGIPTHELPHIFERFHRIHNARARTHEGTGIGLALVQELVRLHGGQITVVSTIAAGTIAAGTTFTVTIPTGTAHLPADRLGAPRSLASTALGADPYVEEALRWLPDPASSMLTPPGRDTTLDDLRSRVSAAALPLPTTAGAAGRRAHILWADDNADMRDYVRRLLSAHYDVEAVPDGQAALVAARARRPDLVLADVMMPQLDGFGVLHALRADPELRLLPVILLSARAGEEARIEGLAAGADAYLVKPFSARELLAHVEAHLELGRLRASLAQEQAEATAELRERNRAEAALREQTEVVETINRVGRTLAAELNLENLVQAVTDAATGLTGAQFGAFFYNVSEAHGESYMLYALSGVPREHFAQFPLPRNTALFEPTFRGTSVIRIPDVKQDPRYGKHAPYYGLPPGHLPVTSYLAVPVISRSGEVLGGLFFGHPQASVFTDRHERLVAGLAAQVAVAVDNARLFAAAQHEITERQQLEEVLREREQQYRNLVQALPAAVYTCDVQGRITLYNEAAVTLWGRVPEIGKDLWCGSWRIYEPDGTPLPLDQCPMAVALREGRAIRGQEIVIERPDGTRRHVLPYPDPIYNAAGEVVGAVNMLLDLTERKQAEETRERLAAIVDSSDDAIIGQTLEGVITSWNRGAERLYGYTAPEVLGQPLSLLIPPDLPDDLPQLLMRLQRGESIDHYETQRLHKDGTRRDVSLTISPIWDSTGRVVGASKIARDITERKRAEAALQRAYAELEQRVADRTALLALMHDITVAANAASSPTAALQVAVERICTYTGWPVGHAYLPEPDGTGQWVPTPIWHLADLTRWAVFQQATQAAPVAPNEGLIGRVGATGAPAWSEDLRTDLAPWQQHAAVQSGLATGCAVPLLVGQEVVGILAFYAEARQAPDAALLDALLQLGTQLGRAVERARAAEQAHRQQEALFQREKLAAMSTLLASVAHELNNPLATILLQAELVGEDVRGSPLAEPVTEIADAAMRCERLVRQFLTLARQHPPERAAVALNTLVTETIELLAYPFRVDNVAVHLHLDDQLPPLWGDPHQLQQVLINLLTNAQQALRAATGAREVTCTTQYDPAQHRITLAVADTGPGIPLALQARIFEPFFTTKPPGVGTGLGLPLCRGIIEAHGGTLDVTSAPDHGATFCITLPVGAMVAAPPATPGTAEGFTERSHTILIVEDEQSLATGLARLLRRDGHTVDTAANGRLALTRLDERTYDLILCDVRMPELDGPSLYRLLERQQPHLCQRCIFLTGDTLEPATQAFLEQSGALCLMKPFSIAEARRAIRRAMRPGHPAAPASAPPATRAIDKE